MTRADSSELSTWLMQTAKGDRVAFDKAYALAYSELRRLAHQIRSGKPRSGLETTALVHECYLKLMHTPPQAENGIHFLAIVARAMRFLLIDEARAHMMQKRDGGAIDHQADPDRLALSQDAQQLLELDDLLSKLELRAPEQVKVIECRYFAGLSEEETAQALNLSLRTVQRLWADGKAWLARQ